MRSRRTLWGTAITALLVLACRSVASTVLDLPPAKTPTAAQAAPVTARAVSPAMEQQADTVRPAIERTTDPDSALTLLPRDSGGRIDWAAAIRDSIVRPRRTIGQSRAGARAGEFGFDFVYRGPNTMFDALFPHSAHVAWMDCSGCHPSIFKYRSDSVTMGMINAGQSCGVCHRSVAFSSGACYRCHVAMPASGTVEPRLEPDIVFPRDSTAAASAGALPPSVFPHWVHRIRYACTACHPTLFPMEVGATKLTMAAMERGDQCGACHKRGQGAFALLECGRCHVPSQNDTPPG